MKLIRKNTFSMSKGWPSARDLYQHHHVLSISSLSFLPLAFGDLVYPVTILLAPDPLNACYEPFDPSFSLVGLWPSWVLSEEDKWLWTKNTKQHVRPQYS